MIIRKFAFDIVKISRDKPQIFSAPSNLCYLLDTQSKQISVIYEEAQKLAHKFDGFADTMDGLENSIAQSQKKFGDAKSKLIDGTGSIKSRVEKMVKLGSKEVEKLETDD